MATIVNISGTGNTYSCYATVNGTKYTSSKSNLELTSREIVFGTYNDTSHSSYGKIAIDGVVVKSSNGDGYNTSYRWTVPSDVTEVNIVLDKSTYSVTVTTKKSESSGSSGGEHYTNIGSTAREIESGTVLIGGVLREIETGIVLVGGVAREIVFAKEMFTVSISGTGNSSYSYVQINGKKYTSAATVELESGSNVYVYANSGAVVSATIKLNGTKVGEGKPCEYNHKVTRNVSISLSYKNSCGSVSITEE